MMTDEVRRLFADRDSPDREIAYKALDALFKMTEKPVGWAYDVWEDLLDDLSHREGSTRAFAAQLLTRLAISDPDARMLNDFPRIAAVMKDGKPVTARHTLQSLWRIGLAGPEQRDLVVDAYEARFGECVEEKGGRIARRDVVTGLGRLWKATGEESIKSRAKSLIDSEPAEKERKQQMAAWRKATRVEQSRQPEESS